MRVERSQDCLGFVAGINDDRLAHRLTAQYIAVDLQRADGNRLDEHSVCSCDCLVGAGLPRSFTICLLRKPCSDDQLFIAVEKPVPTLPPL